MRFSLWQLSVSQLVTLLTSLVLVSCVETEPPKSAANVGGPAGKPNVLLIVVDDVGYTDLGSFGGEIDTPNLDKLANTGLKLTNFHVAPTCSPTRAMLLSGTDNHIAGLGNMAEEASPNQKGQPGYEGYLNERVAALPSLLQDAGYHTYMTGKWHLGKEESNSPAARGFERSYALLDGGAGHFDMLPIIGPGKAPYREDGKTVEKLPENFYSTRFYVDKMIDYMAADKQDDQPFFAYLAFSAPHWPLQAPEESIAKYKGKYDSGYDVLYQKRMEGLRAKGLMPEGAKEWPRLPGEVSWDGLGDEEKRTETRKMEIFAAMVDDIDVHTGRLLEYLENTGQRENTLIIFMSDNGAEGHHLENGWPVLEEWVADCCDNSYENMGKANSYIWYGPNWGRAGSGPFNYFKGFTSEGGIRVPGFINFGGSKRQGEVSDAFVSVMDIMPTILDFADTAHPGKQYKGRDVEPMKGESMRSFLSGQTQQVHSDDYVMGWELFAKRAIRQGDWKITWHPAPYGTDSWQLYNLRNDPSEQTDLAAEEPEKLQKMILLWDQYAKDNNVIIPDWVSGY